MKLQDLRRGSIYEQSINPIFLALNLTQVFIMIKTLIEDDNLDMTSQSAKIAINIYKQLSEHSQRIIKEKLQEQNLWKKIEIELNFCEEENEFYTEEELLNKRDESFIPAYLEKMNRKFVIKYYDNGEKKEIEGNYGGINSNHECIIETLDGKVKINTKQIDKIEIK